MGEVRPGVIASSNSASRSLPLAPCCVTMSGSESFYLTVAIIVVPWLLSEFRRHRQQARHARATNSEPPLRRRWWLTIIVAVHSIWILYKLLVHPPLNIFTSLRVPLTTPAATLRKMLLSRSIPRVETLPQPVEELIMRLSSFDIRTLYIRLV